MVNKSIIIKNVITNANKGLVTNYRGGGGRGGYKTGGGGEHVKIYPYEKGCGKSFSHAKGGHKKVRGNFYAVA